MTRSLLLFLALTACCSAQLFTSDSTPSPHGADKTSGIPPPSPVEVPSEDVTPPPPPSPAPAIEGTTSFVEVDRTALDIPRGPGNQGAVDVPYTPIELPKATVEEKETDYNIPQPIIEVPGPIVQSKPVVYNVPQQVIVVPEPVIRTRPIIYRVPASLSVEKPRVKHNRIFYHIPKASILPKSALTQSYRQGTPFFNTYN